MEVLLEHGDRAIGGSVKGRAEWSGGSVPSPSGGRLHGDESAAERYWSPAPVLGYRVWRIHSRALTGARLVWRQPTLEAVCLSTGATEGIPHVDGQCGPPACGIYARTALTGIRGLRAFAERPGTVAGVVALRGTVVEHENGYRAGEATVLAAGSLWGDQLVVGWNAAWVAALFDDPVATLSGRGPHPDVTRPLPRGGRGASLALLADELEAIGADPAAFGLTDPMET